MAPERLQKIIARAGVTSRRKAEELIQAGRVAVNGRVVRELGATAEIGRDSVTLDGRPLVPEQPRYVAVHKPRGVLCALSDRFCRPLIGDLLGKEMAERLFPAGRLDLESEGLVLMTNDGALMEAITRPGTGVEKLYEVTVEGRPNEGALRQLRRGVELDGQRTLPCSIRWLRRDPPARLEVGLHEGKKNQIRRMFEDIGCPVRRLVRVAIGPVELGNLPPGKYRPLASDELKALYDSAWLGHERPGRRRGTAGRGGSA